MFFSLICLCGCVSESKVLQEKEHSVIKAAETGTITFKNNTPFRVNIVIGSMRTELDPIEPWKDFSIPNTYSETEIYYPYFDIPLMPKEKSFDLLNIKPLGDDNYLQIDNKNKNQFININRPSSFDIKDCYVVFTNKGNKGGVYLSENKSSRLNSIHEHRKNNINQDETEIFLIKPSLNKSLYITGPVSVIFPIINYKAAHVYYFTFDGSSVTLTDSRPLHSIGESSWIKTKEIENATCIMPLVTENKDINLFASTSNEELKRIVYDSAGNNKSTIKSGNSFNITYASAYKDGFFIAGNEKKGKINKPIVLLLGADGVTQSMLPESADYEQTYFLTAAQKNADTWLLAGYGTNPLLINDDGEKERKLGITAYARLIHYENNKFTVVNEWGSADFPLYESINAVFYNSKNDCWLITGEIKEPSTGYYLSLIRNDGKIQEISEFKEMEFYKILVDTSGSYYLAGQEKKGDGTYAAIIKYDVNNKELWRLSKQPPSNSYYYSAILNTENNRIVLVGTLQAKDEYGNGGKPFIESLDMSTGTTDWREILTVFVSSGTNLVTNVSIAPDYGYVLSLAGIIKGNINEPYKIARINSRGKYFEY
jgi:hypothetical protein